MGTSDRDLGGMAEYLLGYWAKQINVTANKANDDREGWDFFLQFPHPSVESDTALDRRDSRIECFVQVKGTTEAQIRKSIKLSNWAKLVESPFPAFFLIFVYSDDSDPVSAYLIHVGERYISRVLQRLHKLKGEDESILNSRRVGIRWTDSDALSSLDGLGLRTAIESHMPNGMEEYTRWKLDTRASAGDPIPNLLRWTKNFDSNDQAWQEVVDFAIGIRDSISVPNMILEEDVRFDIPNKITDLGEGTFKVTARSNIECTLDIHDVSSTTGAVFPAQLYNTRMFFGDWEIPSRFDKWRITFELGELVIETGSGKGNFTLSFPAYEKVYRLDELFNIWRLVDVFSKGDTVQVSITAFSDTTEHQVQAKLTLDDNSIATDDLMQYWEIVNKTRWLSRALDLPPEVQVSVAQLLFQQENIKLLRSVFDPSETDISFSAIVSDDVDGILKKELAIPFVRLLRLGETHILVSFSIAGVPTLIDNSDPEQQQIELVSPRLVLLKHQQYLQDAKISQESILAELKDRLESEGYNILVKE